MAPFSLIIIMSKGQTDLDLDATALRDLKVLDSHRNHCAARPVSDAKSSAPELPGFVYFFR